MNEGLKIFVLSEISKINYPELKVVFSGGTCLSKAYNKIQRFSEDIDFRIHTERTFTRAEKKIFCNFILEKLESKEGFNSCVMYFRVNFNVIQMP